MNNSGYDHGSYHDSHCTGPYCNCDERRYGHHSKSSSSDWVWLVAYLVIGFICPPLGAIIAFIWVFC